MKNERIFAQQLQALLKDDDLLSAANEFIDSIVESMRNGFDDKKLKKEYSHGPVSADGAIEVARARLSVSGKFTSWNRLWMDEYSASYSTPEEVGRYRSYRLSGSNIVDVGSGAGMQSIFFAERSNVTSIEVSRLRYIMGKLNAAVYGARLRKSVNADYAAVIDSIGLDDSTTIFSDPLRPRTEEERTLASLVPSPAVLKKLAAGKTGRFVFDLPPQMSWKNMGEEGEKEYISIGGRLNRLTLYQGETARADASAVILPEKVRVEGNPDDDSFSETDRPGGYLLIPDISLQYSRLLWKLGHLGEFGLISRDGRRTVLTSDSLPECYFPGEVFEVVDTADESSLEAKLSDNGCGRVIMRFQIDPEKYYGLRKSLEAGMYGNKDIYLMRGRDSYILCTRNDGNQARPVAKDVMSHMDY